MTTFDALQTSTENSRPIELFEFIIGSTTHRFASSEDDIVIGADTYVAEAIARSKIEVGADQSNKNVVVTVPVANAVAQQYITVPPGQKATLNIYRYQRDEVPTFGTQLLMFKGQVQSGRFPSDGQTGELAVRSIETALNRNIPRFTFMSMCNHILYDDQCGVDPASFTHVGAASSVTEETITVAGAGASGIDFVGGFLRPASATDFRMIIAQSGDVLTYLLPFASDPTGTNMQVLAGCDHLIEGDCALVFDNVAEFGGFAFVPNKNIFESGLD